jgi:hypothetical protein
MTWYPIGPDFVFAPKNPAFKRLSRRNEYGRQGLVSFIAVDPTDAQTLYVAERPSSGGTSAFRTRDDGTSWTPIVDSLQQTNPRLDPSCFAVNPDHPETIYMGTLSDRGVYVSSSRGDPGSWSARNAINGSVRKIIVDPRTSATLATTVLYAATTNGVYRSPDAGANWTQVQAGDVWSLVAYMPGTGTAHFYAGIWQLGVLHATDPTVAWTNLNTAGIGLPAHTAATTAEPNGNFDAVFVDYCRRTPDRVYAWHMKRLCDAMGQNCGQVTAGIYTTASPTTAWTLVAAASPPAPAYGYYAWSFGVAPNSPGNGTNDVLMAGAVGLQRSINGGQTWQSDGTWFHADQHAVAFSPETPAAGAVPATYIGNDGGIGKSSKFADSTVAIGAAPADYNESYATPDTFAWQNRNHGKQSSAVFQYASDPAVAALSYIGCQDTGVACDGSVLGWRGIADADAGAIAAARATNGVAVWGILGDYGGWAAFRMVRWTDKGEFSPASVFATMPGGSVLAARRGAGSSLCVGLDGKCLAGVVVHDSDTTLPGAVTANVAPQAVTPASMTNIIVGSSLNIEPGANQERVAVTATTATTFTAVFAKNHPAGAAVENDRNLVARIDEAGAATQISQDFVGAGGVRFVAPHPTDPNVLYCATNNNKVFTTNVGATAGPTTVWTEVATGKPAAASIGWVALDSTGRTFVLLLSPLLSGGVTTPLFEVSTGTWLPQTCAGLPTGFTFGKVVVDPAVAGTLYATHGARIYQVVLSTGTWTWTDISDGLPGQWIYDLWIGTIGSGAGAKVLLRAAIPTRAVFERDVTAGAVEPAVSLYLRDNFLDQGWLNPSPDGLVNPYNPPTERVWHYQSADIRIDAQQRHVTLGQPDFFQTDPEGTPIPPLSHVLYDQLNDSSQNLPQTDAAWVHVQVHNRSATAANAVWVWAIFSRISAGVPALSKSATFGDAYPFWDQFQAGGTIAPGLPADSPWRAVGAPVMLNGVDAAHPQIASWSWTIPALATGDPGHYCMVAFVHSATSGVGETTRMSVDAITPTNRQVGQKNLHIGPALPPGPSPDGGGGQGDGPGGSPGGTPLAPFMEEYVEFHNPTAAPRRTDFVFDLRRLPPALGVSFHLTELDTGGSIEDAVDGVAGTRDEPVPDKWARAARSSGGGLLGCLHRCWCWLVNAVRRLFGLPRKACGPSGRGAIPPFVPVRYDAAPSALVRVRSVTLPPFGFGAALLRIEPKGGLPPGAEFRFDVQQRFEDDKQRGGAVAGGATVAVVIAGDPERRKPVTPPSHDPDVDQETKERIEEESEGQQPVLPWAEEIMEQRRKEQHRD